MTHVSMCVGETLTAFNAAVLSLVMVDWLNVAATLSGDNDADDDDHSDSLARPSRTCRWGDGGGTEDEQLI